MHPLGSVPETPRWQPHWTLVHDRSWRRWSWRYCSRCCQSQPGMCDIHLIIFFLNQLNLIRREKDVVSRKKFYAEFKNFREKIFTVHKILSYIRKFCMSFFVCHLLELVVFSKLLVSDHTCHPLFHQQTSHTPLGCHWGSSSCHGSFHCLSCSRSSCCWFDSCWQLARQGAPLWAPLRRPKTCIGRIRSWTGMGADPQRF